MGRSALAGCRRSLLGSSITKAGHVIYQRWLTDSSTTGSAAHLKYDLVIKKRDLHLQRALIYISVYLFVSYFSTR